jgi:hypothetical protein
MIDWTMARTISIYIFGENPRKLLITKARSSSHIAVNIMAIEEESIGRKVILIQTRKAAITDNNITAINSNVSSFWFILITSISDPLIEFPWIRYNLFIHEGFKIRLSHDLRGGKTIPKGGILGSSVWQAMRKDRPSRKENRWHTTKSFLDCLTWLYLSLFFIVNISTSN